jgi:hypothetical protein
MRAPLRRPSPSLAISLVALLVALGGTGYAAVAINGKNIKDRSIAGKKLKSRTITRGKIRKDALTGGEVNESTLGPVPSAKRAGGAASATVAGQLFHAENNEDESLSQLSSAQDEVLSLTVPPGRYLVTGGGFLNQNTDAPDRRECRLSAGASFDQKFVGVAKDSAENDTSAFWLGLPVTAAKPTKVSLSCEGGTSAVVVGGRRILAYRVAAIIP